MTTASRRGGLGRDRVVTAAQGRLLQNHLVNFSGSNSPQLAAFVVIPNEVRDLKIPRHAWNDREYLPLGAGMFIDNWN